jgi:predicted peroxiredoxin
MAGRMTGHEFWNGFSEKKGKRMAEKTLVNATYGTDDVERATVPFVVASVSAASDNETVMFLTAQSVRLATRGGADGVQGEGYPAIADLIEATIENGGKIWVCLACASANGIGADDLIEGASIVGAAGTIGFLADGARTIM